MKLFHGTITIQANSALLIGGHTQQVGYLDSTTAQKISQSKESRIPIIPASALRGAMREALVRMLNGLEHPDADNIVRDIFGEEGVDYTPHHAEEEAEQDRDEPTFTKQHLRLFDAELTDLNDVDFSVRHGVGIDRKTGHAKKGHYYQREVANVQHKHFCTSFYLHTTEENFSLLQKSFLLIDSIGNSKSRGLGSIQVRAELTPSRAISLFDTVPQSEYHRVVLTTASPLFLGGFRTGSFFQETQPYIPGSTIRGAIIWMLVRAHKDREPLFQTFVDSVFFSDFWPQGRTRHLTGPAPRTVLQTKHDTEKQKPQLIDSIVIKALTKDLHDGEPQNIRDDYNRLMTPSDVLLVYENGQTAESPTTNIVTRLEVDHKTGAHKEGMLYSRQQVIGGASYIGNVCGMTPQLRNWLNSAHLPVQIGGLRAKGLGKIETLKTEAIVNTVQSRIQKYNAQIQNRLGNALLSKLNKANRTFIQVVARTPICLSDNLKEDFSIEHTAQYIAEQLFPHIEDIVVEYTSQRDGVRSGWKDARWEEANTVGLAPVFQVIEAGSTWLYSLPSAQSKTLNYQHIFHIENKGLGAQQALGIGRIVICPQTVLFPKGDSQ